MQSVRLLPTHVLTRAHKLWQHRMVINALGGALYSVVLKPVLFFPPRTNKIKLENARYVVENPKSLIHTMVILLAT